MQTPHCPSFQGNSILQKIILPQIVLFGPNQYRWEISPVRLRLLKGCIFTEGSSVSTQMRLSTKAVPTDISFFWFFVIRRSANIFERQKLVKWLWWFKRQLLFPTNVDSYFWTHNSVKQRAQVLWQLLMCPHVKAYYTQQKVAPPTVCEYDS